MFILEPLLNEKITKNIDILNNYATNAILIDNGRYVINKKYKIGHISAHNGKFYLSSQIDGRDILIDKDDLLGSNEGDFVLTRVIFNPRGKLKVKVALIIERNSEQVLVLYKNNHFISVKNGNNLHIKHTPHCKEGDLYLINNDVYEYFGNINDSKIDEKISLYLYKEEYRLSPYELENVDKKISFGNRVDLTELDFCTIDPVGARDHDDAIYFDYEKEILYVAIADVSHYVKEGTFLDDEAKKRAFSVYFPNKVLPMLPFILSSDLCSLKPNETRYAFVCKIELDLKSLSVKKSEFFEAIIESKNNFSYEVIDEKIAKNELSKELAELLKVTQNLRTKRLANGYNFRNEELKLILDKDEELMDVKGSHSTLSHQLVEECMLLANQESAKKIGNLGIFRIHEEPDMKKIDKLIEELIGIGLHVKKKKDVHSTIISIQKEASRFFLEKEVDQLIIKAQQQAKYSSHISNHFGLGFSHYSHFTSPIRRYADLTLHRILKTKKIPKEIDNICEQISNSEREIAQMVWDLEGRKYARWATKNLNQIFTAVISDVGDIIYGELQEPICGLKFQIQNHKGEKLYNKVRISLTEVDLISKKIYGKIIK
jgi:ribonuclease R